MSSLSQVVRGYGLSTIGVLAWWLVVLAVLLGVQVDVVTRPLPGGARFIAPWAQYLLLGLVLSVPLAAGLAAGWRDVVARSRSGGARAIGRGLLAGLIALPALLLAFVVLDFSIESIIAVAPDEPWYLAFSGNWWGFLILQWAVPTAAAGALLGSLGGLLGGLIAARGGSAGVRRGARRPA